MTQPPVPGHGQGAQPGRDPGLPGGSSGSSGSSGLRLRDFASAGAGDACPPGPRLAAALDRLSGSDRRCSRASDDELIGLLSRWEALESWAAAGKLGVLAELLRRRAEPGHERRAAADLPDAWDETTGHEVAAALAMSPQGADKLIDLAFTLQARLPGVYAALTDGIISALKATIICGELAVLDDAHAAQAEALILGELAGKTPGMIGKLAAQAAATVDPEGSAKRRERAEREEARVRFWRDNSGACAIAAYGLPTDEALAANANIQARAKQYKKAKVNPDATMDQLRVLAFLDIINGISAEARITRARTAQAKAQAKPPAQAEAERGRPDDDCPRDARPVDDPVDDRGGDDWLGDDNWPADGPTEDDRPHDDHPDDGPTLDDRCGDDWRGADWPSDDDWPRDDHRPTDDPPGDDPDRSRTGPGPSGAELAASINLTIPLGTVLGQSQRPGLGHGLGPIDPALARDLAAAAARSPHSTWCVTVTNGDGIAIGHGCAKPARKRKRKGNPAPCGGGRDGPATGPPDGTPAFTPRDDPGPPGGYGTWTLTLPGGQDLDLTLLPIPVTDCDHRYESHGYQPSDLLRHLVQIRDGVCTFPCCSRHARESDFEHAIPFEKGGRTCGCNAGARSRRCHRVKQSKGWSVTQPRPGWHRWTTPSGRAYTQGPMKYPI